MSYQLGTTALKPQGAQIMGFFERVNNFGLTDIPPEDTIVALGMELLDSTVTWEKGATFAGGKVLTLHLPKGPGGTPWHCRVSEHTKEDATFGEFWGKLGVNKAVNEKEFIRSIKKVAEVKRISETRSIWTLYYKFMAPGVSPRVFTVVQTVRLSESPPKSGIIVSIPIDLSADEELAKIEEKGTKGRYVSVERLLELGDGKVEWRMATSSTPGGRIPAILSEFSIPGQIAADVPHFLNWFHTVRAKADHVA